MSAINNLTQVWVVVHSVKSRVVVAFNTAEGAIEASKKLRYPTSVVGPLQVIGLKPKPRKAQLKDEIARLQRELAVLIAKES
jgi:hypothetical protein|tara:strand:+ start:308 stop:553 length:246 start_codon:yes stop_codon:yes gene_type:complete